MSRPSSLILLGALVILAPFSGFPSSWITLFLVVLGALTVLVGFSLKKTQVHTAVQAEALHAAPAEESTSPTTPPHGISPI